MKTSTIITSLKIKKRNETLKKSHMKIRTHQTGRMIQVTTSSKIKTEITKKIPPLKVTAQKND